MRPKNSFVRRKNILNLKSSHTRKNRLRRALQIFCSSLSNKSCILTHPLQKSKSMKKKKKEPRLKLTTHLFNESNPRRARPKFKMIVNKLAKDYVKSYLKFHKSLANFPLYFSNKPRLISHKYPIINKRVAAKLKKIARDKLEVRAGILFSCGLDSTVLKEKVLAMREDINLTVLFCFFFTKGNDHPKPTNESNQAVREQEALKRIKEFQKNDENGKFVRIIEIDAVPMSPSENLFCNKDRHSPANHNQWMVLRAIAHSVESNFYINKFYFDVDCGKNDSFCDTEPSYLAIQPFIDHMTDGATQLERIHCFPEATSYLEEKRLKIDYLKKLGLWDKISFCYANNLYVFISFYFFLFFFIFSFTLTN